MDRENYDRVVTELNKLNTLINFRTITEFWPFDREAFWKHTRQSFQYRLYIAHNCDLLSNLKCLHPIVFLDNDESGYEMIYNEDNDCFCCHAQTIIEQCIIIANIEAVTEYFQDLSIPVYHYNELNTRKDYSGPFVTIMTNVHGESYAPLPIENREFIDSRGKFFYESIIVRLYKNKVCTLELYLPKCQFVTADKLKKVIDIHPKVCTSFECPACFSTDIQNQKNIVYCLGCFKCTCVKCYQRIKQRNQWLFKCPWCRDSLNAEVFTRLLDNYSKNIPSIQELNNKYKHVIWTTGFYSYLIKDDSQIVLHGQNDGLYDID